MKFLAAILITNSHMGSIYPEKFNLLATGGAIGDAIFFFCSGYLLMMGRNMDFPNWYKRRVNRILPTIFGVALIGIVVLGKDPTLKDVLVKGGGWFIKAIFVFYAFFWFVKRYASERLWIAFAIDAVVVLVWFVWFWDKDVFILSNGTYLRWPVFFMVMMMGAYVQQLENSQIDDNKGHLWQYTGLLVASLLLYYGYQIIWGQFPVLKEMQIVLLPVLLGITFCIYRICSSTKVSGLYTSKYVYWPVYYISACCLEIYLSGGWSFGVGRSLIGMFPLNVIVTFLMIFVIAYIVKVFCNFLTQTFKTENYDWMKMVRL
jgi:peptidoglycan/LPS O-acetylase OafA/YrhL